jgi:hypothetical protein
MKRSAVVMVLTALLVGGIADARVARAPSPFAGGNFIVDCGFSHRAADDPILLRGLPAGSHDHTFFGNASTDAFSTDATLLAGDTLCHRTADRSAYWVPTLLKAGRPVLPLGTAVYYRRRTYAPVKPLPTGLRMVAGNPDAREPQGIERVWWNCRPNDPKEADVPVCPPGDDIGLRLHVNFPACWDGMHLDSVDQSHMTYDVDGTCPPDHPVAVPSIMLVVPYPVSGGEALALASGNLHSAHADVFVAWRGSAQARLVERCVNGRRDCARSSDGVEECPVELPAGEPPVGEPTSCPDTLSELQSLSCRLDEIASLTEAASGLANSRRRKLLRGVGRASRSVLRGALRCARGDAVGTDAALESAGGRLSIYDDFLRSDPRRCALPSLDRSALLQRIAQLLVDVDAARRSTPRICTAASG